VLGDGDSNDASTEATVRRRVNILRRAPAPEREPMGTVCLECGIPAPSSGGAFCRRCGLPYGAPPRPYRSPTCPICYRNASDDGRFDSLIGGYRADLVRHIAEHEQVPVGDDDFLEGLREGDTARIGRWTVPFDLLRRYLVLGVVEAGRSRQVLHNALLSAMAQMSRWGPDAVVIGDQPELAEARAELAEVMERYHRTR
jgi:hypothetical protein